MQGIANPSGETSGLTRARKPTESMPGWQRATCTLIYSCFPKRRLWRQRLASGHVLLALLSCSSLILSLTVETVTNRQVPGREHVTSGAGVGTSQLGVCSVDVTGLSGGEDTCFWLISKDVWTPIWGRSDVGPFLYLRDLGSTPSRPARCLSLQELFLEICAWGGWGDQKGAVSACCWWRLRITARCPGSLCALADVGTARSVRAAAGTGVVPGHEEGWVIMTGR